MGLARLSLIIGIFVVIFAVLYGWEHLFGARDPSSYSLNIKYFGPTIPLSNDTTEDLSIRTFKVPFERSQFEDVIHRLTKTRFYEPQILIDKRYVNQPMYGFNRKTAESVREYWINTYDWKKTVQELNTFNHYKTRISGLDIHFVRVKHNNNKAILFLHGWPSSFIEYLDVARLLNSSISSTYDLIIPSLPGFGYSDAPVRSGLTASQIAAIMHSLMQRIGYNSYVICGGDWGSVIGTHMAQLYPNYVRGLLITFIPPVRSLKHDIQSLIGHYINPSFILDSDEQEFLRNRFDAFEYFKFFWYEGGYMHIQATKPDTLGYALNDSPMGLATYILEKWSRWSNNQTEIERSINSGLDRFTLDQLLSNIMLYWTTGTITSSMRIYFEEISSASAGHDDKLLDGPLPKSVPVAIVNYRYEVTYTPRIRAKVKYPNIKLWSFHKEGGHFASIEKPREYSRDVEAFLSQL